MEFRRRTLLFVLFSVMLEFVNGKLHSKCSSDEECTVANSRCVDGQCICKPYFAEYGDSSCLQSRLLDQNCIVNEQCTLKVSHSACIAGKCKCSSDYLQFRRHTCLTAAKPGDVCLSNEHCKLHTRNSYCHFLIPNLIGRCACNTHTNQFGDSCVTEDREMMTELPERVHSSTESREPEVSTDTERTEPTEEEEIDIYEAQNPKKKEPANSDPFYDQRKHHLESTTVTEEVLTEANPGNQSGAKYRESSGGPLDNITEMTFSGAESSRRKVSLGWPCSSDAECQSADPGSRCENNLCSCVFQGNATETCNRDTFLCPPETFQCRSTGACLSWFFVCDGRIDCADGSDEECSGTPCPRHSFQCGDGGICVSRAAVCDGTRNCPNGEDELVCGLNDAGRCPPHSFQCENGQCVPEYEFCNAIPSCSDGSDEREEMCGSLFDEEKQRRISDFCPFRCRNGRCRSTAIMCSGRDGCGDNSDESQCTVCRCPSGPGYSR